MTCPNISQTPSKNGCATRPYRQTAIGLPFSKMLIWRVNICALNHAAYVGAFFSVIPLTPTTYTANLRTERCGYTQGAPHLDLLILGEFP